MAEAVRILLPIAGVLVVLMVVAALLGWLGLGRDGAKAASASKGQDGPLPYRPVESLLSRGELAFYRSLRVAIGDERTILAKVRLADLLRVEASGADWQRHFNRINAKHADFVLCDPATLRPIVVIELDDTSHQRASRRDRDGFVERALLDAGLPLLRVRAAAAYVPAEVAGQLRQLLSPDPGQALSSRPPPARTRSGNR